MLYKTLVTSLKASPPLLLHLMEWQALFKETSAEGGV